MWKKDKFFFGCACLIIESKAREAFSESDVVQFFMPSVVALTERPLTLTVDQYQLTRSVTRLLLRLLLLLLLPFFVLLLAAGVS